ncbi:ty3-gypsy retrotransposon protein [Cucumis melo var. makuwa]|uniref:Ty3-gypsy retrotransposon protein n=1 Tax=Cucumis melo var. makuwa TaxID=1194695 RepID=A0A5A7VJT9_CUCMM|nr:ty3-gypsy retrotransposon protein [Cucumis melo var. makuwa]TYK30268.1 ty3-gypsy retrotransposon protein [Cucumis melo var. makuwa]
MTSNKVSSKSSITSDAYTRPVTYSRSKGIIQKQDQGSVIAQSILKQLVECSKAEIVIKENPLYDNFDSPSSKSKRKTHPDVMSVMMANVTIEAAMAEMERKINLLMKLEKEFLNHFYSTRRTVSMMEFTNMKEQKGEPVIDYINRWRDLSLDCKDRLTELSVVEMCTQELATQAHDMKLSIVSKGTKDFPFPKVRKDKKEMKDVEKIVKSTMKEIWFSKRKYCIHARASTREAADPAAGMLVREKKIKLDLEEVAQTNHAEEVALEDSQGKERSAEEDDEGWIV